MSNIEWTEQTWNPITGCSRVSEGCKNCYAEVMTRRLQAMGQPKYQGLLNEHGRFNGKVRFDETALLAPLKRKKPTTYFVNSMSDLFHEHVADEWIDKIFAVMALCPQHTFQILTKRAERMRAYMIEQKKYVGVIGDYWLGDFVDSLSERFGAGIVFTTTIQPLSNVHLGVSTENQEQADARIPHLLETPAAVRFVSAEPLLGEIDFSGFLQRRSVHHLQASIEGIIRQRAYGCLTDDDGRPMSRRDAENELLRRHAAGEKYLSTGKCEGFDTQTGCPGHPDPRLDWVIVGGESGPNARKCNIDWIRSVVNQCKAADVPVFVKQMSAEWAKSNKCDKGDIKRFPVDLQLREFPR